MRGGMFRLVKIILVLSLLLLFFHFAFFFQEKRFLREAAGGILCVLAEEETSTWSPIPVELFGNDPVARQFAVAYNNYMPAAMWSALQRLKESPKYEQAFRAYSQTFSPEDYLRCFFVDSAFSIFGLDDRFETALYNLCETRDFRQAEQLLRLYRAHPRATQKTLEKFEQEVAYSKTRFPVDDFFWVLPDNGKQTRKSVAQSFAVGYTETLHDNMSSEEARRDEVWVSCGGNRTRWFSYDPRMGRAIIWHASRENMLVGLVQSYLPSRPVYGGYVDMTPRVRVLNNNPAERWKWELFIIPGESLTGRGAKPAVRHIGDLSNLLKDIGIKEDFLMPPAHFWEIIVEQIREGKL